MPPAQFQKRNRRRERDKMMAELRLERADFIKMDFEGAEPRALAGAKETLAKYKPRMAIRVYHSKSDLETIQPSFTPRARITSRSARSAGSRMAEFCRP